MLPVSFSTGGFNREPTGPTNCSALPPNFVGLIRNGPGNWELDFALKKSTKPNQAIHIACLKKTGLFGRVDSGVDVLTSFSFGNATSRSGYSFTLESVNDSR